MKRCLACLFVLLPLLAVSCATVDPVTGRRTRNMYLIEDDIQMGRQVKADVVKSMREGGVPINADGRTVAKLQDMVNRIAAVSHLPDLPFEVTLFQTNIVNAFAAPGGQMGVFTGLYHPEIGLVKDDDELAAVIAHEIAHVTCRHTTESLTRALPMQMLLIGGSIYAEAKGKEDLALALGAGFLVYQGLVLPKFSRKDESEADAVGLMYMARAGYDPRAAVRIWERAAARGKDPKLFAMFSSHPTDRDRAEALRKLLPQAMEEYERARGK
ncbi:MAG TPA: M48 family metallopeptidase [Kiritimatiellia bacterium]|nr:M48 family metallopeptidase [Kiritimatiellia bacterium]